jgi:hypothetical protein
MLECFSRASTFGERATRMGDFDGDFDGDWAMAL